MKKSLVILAVCAAAYFVAANGAAQPTDCPQWPDQATRMLTKTELERCDCNQLELLRNEVYARHGRKFKREDLRKYFESQPWYKYDPKNPNGDKGLNRFEKANVTTIANFEKSIGCGKAGSTRPDTTYNCESIDGFRLSQPISSVVQKYGKPNRTKIFKTDPDLDCSRNEDYYYDDLGLTFNACEGRILEISILSNSKFKTSRNIGIGASKADVQRAYKVDEWAPDITDPTPYGADTTLASSDCPITTLFYLKNGKVVRIVWTGYP